MCCCTVFLRTGSKLGISPLMLAAMNGHTSTVKLLLDMGSDINAQVIRNGRTFCKFQISSVEMESILLTYNCSIHVNFPSIQTVHANERKLLYLHLCILQVVLHHAGA